MVDFEAKRVQDLFKDEERTELKEGITARDINSIASMTPIGRQDLQSDIQRAYKLVYEKNTNGLNKPGDFQPMQQIQAPPTNGSQIEKNPMAEQFMNMYNKIKDIKSDSSVDGSEIPPINTQLEKDYNELQNLNKEYLNLIEELKKEKEELLNQQDEMEKEYLEKYKILNDKYEKLNNSVPNKEISDLSLLEYLKETNERLEQKQCLLQQEIGRLKGLLGI